MPFNKEILQRLGSYNIKADVVKFQGIPTNEIGCDMEEKKDCTHRCENGNISLKQNTDGSHTCAICGETFSILEPEKFKSDVIADICLNLNDLVQSIIVMHGNTIKKEDAKMLRSIIAFIPQLSKLRETSILEFDKLTESAIRNCPAPFGFNLLSALMNPQYPPLDITNNIRRSE